MKLLFLALAVATLLQSPAPTPVTWSFAIEQVDADEYIVTATADVEDGWSLYSQDNDGSGPVPTVFTYANTQLDGETEELSEVIVKYSDLFETEVKKFKNKAVFKQKLKVAPGAKAISGTVYFMCCDDVKCLPPATVAFDLEL